VALTWSDESADTMVAGYKVYYDQAGKAQLLHDTVNDPAPLGTTFTDTGLTNGVEYCYKVSSYYDATCESAYSGIVCAIPTNPVTDLAGVTTLQTGTVYNAGDNIVIRATVVDNVTGLPLPNAIVDLLITGPEGLTLVTGLSNANGIVEATWNTIAPSPIPGPGPGGGNPGTTPGTYTVQTTNVTATGYHWDGVTTSITFTIQ
jgi:hypothetical protein